MGEKREPLPWTQFNYDEFFEDPAVVAMGDALIGPYLRLLRAAWKACLQGWPDGCLPNDDTYLAGASGMGTLWVHHRSAIAAAFTILPDWWIQRRIVRDYADHHLKMAARVESGKLGAAKRWHGPMGDPWVPHSIRMGDFRSKRLESKKESTPLLTSGEQQLALVGGPNPDDTPGDRAASLWVQSFDQFWGVYPRKVSKKRALRAWRAIKPQTEDNFNRIMDSLDHWIATWRSEGRTPDKIPHPATWLNDARWEDHT